MIQFPSMSILKHLVLTNMIPSSIASQSTAYAIEDEAIIVDSDYNIPDKYGIKYLSKAPKLKKVSSWLEIFPMKKDEASYKVTLLHFSSKESLISFAREVLYLNNDRQSYCCFKNNYFLKIIEIPYYSLLYALDNCSVYTERRDRIWCKHDFTHPFIHAISTEQTVLIDNEWKFFPDLKFKDIYEIMDFSVANSLSYKEGFSKERFKIPFNLKPSSTIKPELWITEDYNLVSDFIQENLCIADKFSFAISDNKILIKSRIAKPIPLLLNIPAYFPYLNIPNLFLPENTRINPPLRKDFLKSLLSKDDNLVYWVDKGFMVSSISANSFLPFSSWAEYVIDHDAEYIKNWINSFQFKQVSHFKKGS